MFDIGFFELLVIAIIALLVLGPERLPHAVRMTGAWIGKIRRASLSVREEIEREIDAYEIRQRIKEQANSPEFQDAKAAFDEAQKQLHDSMVDQNMLKQIEAQNLEHYRQASQHTPPGSDQPANPEISTPSSARPKSD